MKYWLIVVVTLLSVMALKAQPVPDSLVMRSSSDIGFLIIGEAGTGIFEDNVLKSFQGGLAFRYKEKFQIKLYGQLYSELFHESDDTRCSFQGFGVRIGPLRRVKEILIYPSFGVEVGKMTTKYYGTISNYHDVLLDEKDEDITFLPISLELQRKIGKTAVISGRIFTAINSDHPIYGLSLGLGIGLN